VKFYPIVISFFVLNAHGNALATSDLPKGYSEWKYEEVCDAECQKDERPVTHIVEHVWLYRSGKQICGFVEEAYAPRGKVASGRIAGQRVAANKYSFYFTDDFSHNGKLGFADLDVKNDQITINVKEHTDGLLGFLSATPHALKKIKNHSYFKQKFTNPDVISCQNTITHAIDFLNDAE